MPITITFDHQNGQLDMELEAGDNPHPRLLRIAVMLLMELNEQLQYDPETCPECQAEAQEEDLIH